MNECLENTHARGRKFDDRLPKSGEMDGGAGIILTEYGRNQLRAQESGASRSKEGFNRQNGRTNYAEVKRNRHTQHNRKTSRRGNYSTILDIEVSGLYIGSQMRLDNDRCGHSM